VSNTKYLHYVGSLRNPKLAPDPIGGTFLSRQDGVGKPRLSLPSLSLALFAIQFQEGSNDLDREARDHASIGVEVAEERDADLFVEERARKAIQDHLSALDRAE
jgi:hypothetical protein